MRGGFNRAATQGLLVCYFMTFLLYLQLIQGKISLAIGLDRKLAYAIVNGYIERINRTYREEILDAYLFCSLREAREISEAWMKEYNAIRPYESLQGLPTCSYVGKNT
ncbi:MAG: integrase core domain-containing protein [Candidatus Helarchaeota archaeon]